MKMDKFWIISLILSTAHKTNGQSNIEVQLITKKYVEKGSSVTFYCHHNVDLDILYKVAWLRGGEHKFFEYIHNRDPPFVNLTTPGADIDFTKSNESQVTLMNLDFDAAGSYYCEVSISNPIFTKASNEEILHVIVKQTGAPKILFKKRLFVVGENLIANCTTTRSKPVPHITWLINGKKVDDSHTTILHPFPYNTKHNRSKSHHNNVQQSDQQNKSDFNDIRGNSGSTLYGKITNTAQDPYDYESSPYINETEHHRNHPFTRNGFFKHRPRDRAGHRSHRPFGNVATQNIKDVFRYSNNDGREEHTNRDFYDSKSFPPITMHRNALSTFHKIRRHLNEPRTSKTNSIKLVINRLNFAASQLSIEVSELHADEYGRLEISCMSTIPAKVGPGEMFADFKSYSVKIDVKSAERSPSTHYPVPTVVGMAALGNRSSKPQNVGCFYVLAILIVSQCLPFSIFYSFLLM